MHRRHLLHLAATATITAALTREAAASPSAATTRPWLAVPPQSSGGWPVDIIAERLSLSLLAVTDPLAALRQGGVAAALLPVEDLEPLAPGAALLDGMPFGPSPAALERWLGSSGGQAAWRRCFSEARFRVHPAALAPSGGVAGGATLSGLPHLQRLPVAAPGATAALWRALGASTDRHAAIRDGAQSPVRGFGPRTRILALVAGPRWSVNGRVQGPLRLEAPTAIPSTTLPAEIMVAAGAHLGAVIADLTARGDPVLPLLAHSLAALRDPAAFGLSWPWTSNTAGTIPLRA